MKTRRMFYLLMALTLVIPLLISCAAPATQAPATEAVAETTEEETPLIKRYAGETIRILMYEQVPTYSTLDRLAEFEEATGIKVEYELLAEAEMIKKETLDFSSHTGTYDVTNVHFWYVPQFAKVGYLEPLDQYVQDMSVPEWDSMSDFVPSYLGSQKYEGALYGLPFRASCRSCTTEGPDRPVLWRQGTRNDGRADDLLAGNHREWKWRSVRLHRSRLSRRCYVYEPGWLDLRLGLIFLDENYHPQLTTPEAIAAMKHYVTLLHDYGPKGQASMGWAEAEQAILNGVAAMHADTHDLGPDMVNPERSQFPEDITFAMPPKEARYSQDFFASGLSINADSKHKEAAWLFVQWATAAATQKEQLAERSDFTVNSVLESDEYRTGVPGGEVILEAAKVADPQYFPAIPEFGALSDVFSAAVSRMVAEGRIV
jgi:ABC-type glycerol-3-phosphate transport system substrate-binding protein